uniref:Uncharacterized protein n=1 Tax=Tanacetum cinerariifolium TaxID=118510 RepID=A0A699GUK4_TANCI|nr:hypothetical protein [Tanacetum cinerariifolium]
MELVIEQTQQGTSYEVSVSTEGIEELKRKVKIKGEKKEALLTLRQKLVVTRGDPARTKPDPSQTRPKPDTVSVDPLTYQQSTLTIDCHVNRQFNKWVQLPDMADDVAATSAKTWQEGPTLPCGGSDPMRGCHVAVLTYFPVQVAGNCRLCQSEAQVLQAWDPRQ